MNLGLLQREVAEIIGVTESSIWNWECEIIAEDDGVIDKIES